MELKDIFYWPVYREYEETLRPKLDCFRESTKTKKTLHLTMITTYGVKKNLYSGIVQSEVTVDDLFRE